MRAFEACTGVLVRLFIWHWQISQTSSHNRNMSNSEINFHRTKANSDNASLFFIASN